MIEALMPPDLPATFALVLVLAAAFTSALTASVGLGGGLAMLAVMSTGMPVAALIPVHGVVQLGSNVGRAAVQRRHIHWRTLLVMTAGSLIGASIGAMVVVSLPEAVLKFGLAAFITWAVFGPKPRLSTRGSDALMFGGGAMGSFVSMFFGATGPITMSILATRGLVKHTLVATFAGAMVMQHFLKVLAFGSLGFDYGPWVPLLAAMIASGFLGTIYGSKLLDRMPDSWFERGFKVMMAFFAVNLVWQGIQAL